MDKQGRLTKKSEFQIGAKYKVKKNGRMAPDIYEFIRFEGSIICMRCNDQDIIKCGWGGIFIPIIDEAFKLRPLHGKELHYIAQEITKDEVLTEVLDKKLQEIQTSLNMKIINGIDGVELAEDLINDLRNALRWVIFGNLK